jgi:hypothetical protein
MLGFPHQEYSEGGRGAGAGERNGQNNVCTYEQMNKEKKRIFFRAYTMGCHGTQATSVLPGLTGSQDILALPPAV